MSNGKNDWNQKWQFTKDSVAVSEGSSVLASGSWEELDLPHTWNGEDGQDGGNDYYRGTCYYVKSLKASELPEGDEIYIEFEGANSSADLYVNGQAAAHHDGGYSTWRANITGLLKEDNEIVVAVDNAPNDRVYPQMADFTFYGGLYRNVNLIGAKKARFDLDYFGGPGIAYSQGRRQRRKGSRGCVPDRHIRSGEGNFLLSATGDQVIAETVVPASEASAEMEIVGVHLWNGRKDPHLYTMKAVLAEGGVELDAREVRFGCRTYEIDPERGFILNGAEYPLHGVSRHQDRPKKGNAISRADHEEDIALIMELGATTIRLAHYQHDQYFYDLCDENGLVIWAEIPYISRHMPTGRENTISQMKELITQNYNHPCIVVWGLSNEITMGGESDPDLIENHRILNDLAHEMDPTRLTTVAVVSMCSIDAEYLKIPDVISYNHYYGWYGGDTSMNGPFFDNFHAKYPKKPVGMSEYGCEALNWHTSNPEQGDYTEEYQAYYHEELIKQLFTRPLSGPPMCGTCSTSRRTPEPRAARTAWNHKGTGFTF